MRGVLHEATAYVSDVSVEKTSTVLDGKTTNKGGPSSPQGGKCVRTGGNTLKYTWPWQHGFMVYRFSFTLHLGIPFDGMQAKYNVVRIGKDKVKAVLNDPYNGTVKVVADHLYSLAEQENVPYAELALGFVQMFPYDDENHEIGRYASETLVDFRGDCHQKTVLMASLLYHHRIGFVFLSFPEHIALGIWADYDEELVHYRLDGRKYFFAEPTTDTFEPIGTGLDRRHGNGRAEITRFYR